MDLSALIQQANLSHKSLFEAIETGSDEKTDTLSAIYETHVCAALDYVPTSLNELEEKTRFIFDLLLSDHEDSTQTKVYVQIILEDIKRLK